jgi:hypothetical protein
LLPPEKLNESDSYLVVARRESTRCEENRKRVAKQHRNNAAGKVLEHDPQKVNAGVSEKIMFKEEDGDGR